MRLAKFGPHGPQNRILGDARRLTREVAKRAFDLMVDFSRTSMPRTFFAALAAASALASGVSAHAEQRARAEEDRVMDRAVEAHTSENRGGTTGATYFGCPDAHTPYDYVAYCPPDRDPAVAEAARTMAQAPVAGCALPSEPWGIPAALDAAISGPADKDRACMKALLIPEAHLIFASVGADGSPSYRLQTLDDWIARAKSRGHITLEEKQLNFRLETEGAVAHVWSLYALRADGKAVARGVNSIQAVKEAGGWRVVSIMVLPESGFAPFPEGYVL